MNATAHNHIERAKRRLGVCTRVQVIVQALSDGQISFGDVIKVETQRAPVLREARKENNQRNAMTRFPRQRRL